MRSEHARKQKPTNVGQVAAERQAGDFSSERHYSCHIFMGAKGTTKQGFEPSTSGVRDVSSYFSAIRGMLQLLFDSILF